MSSNKQSSRNASVDFKKLYSAHVQENFSLQRHKSDMDSAKIKKLRELNFNEKAFLRKYDKYTSGQRSASLSSHGSRRGSIDPSVFRVAVSRTQSRSDETNHTQTSLGRYTVNGDCPYSYDTWNRMVDTQQNIIDANKISILCGDSTVDSDNDKADDLLKTSPRTMDSISEMNVSKAETTLKRRRTVKPIEVNTADNLIDDNMLDAEIQEIQGVGQDFRSRSHSMAGRTFPVRSVRRFSVDSGIKLPSLDKVNKTKTITRVSRKQSLSNSSLDIHTPVSNVGNVRASETEHTVVKKSVSKYPLLVDATSIPKITITDHDNTTPDEKRPQKVPRPVANAAIFIQGETGVAERTSEHAGNDCNDDQREEMESRTSSVVLPAICQSPSILINSGKHKCLEAKTVTFEDDHMRPRSESCSSIRSSSSIKLMSRNGRRQSMTSTTLHVLVDSHHGAAKLRYMALLATEMEREEASKQPPLPEPETDVFCELQSCRYLRTKTRKGSDGSDSSVI